MIVAIVFLVAVASSDRIRNVSECCSIDSPLPGCSYQFCPTNGTSGQCCSKYDDFDEEMRYCCPLSNRTTFKYCCPGSDDESGLLTCCEHLPHPPVPDRPWIVPVTVFSVVTGLFALTLLVWLLQRLSRRSKYESLAQLRHVIFN